MVLVQDDRDLACIARFRNSGATQASERYCTDNTVFSFVVLIFTTTVTGNPPAITVAMFQGEYGVNVMITIFHH